MRPIRSTPLRVTQAKVSTDTYTPLTQTELEHWLEALPLLKPKSIVKQLTTSINASNLLEIKPDKRLTLLQEYRAEVLLINPSLTLDALKRLSIKEDERELLQIQTSTLYLTLTDGYKIIINHALSNNASLQHETTLLSIYHAMEMLSLTLLHCYRSYKSAPRHLFQDLFQLYALAEQAQLLDQDIETGNLSLAATTIDKLFKQIMYLSCINPYHLAAGTIEKLYERLSRFSLFCQLSNADTATENNSAFAINLAQDAPPCLLSKADLIHSDANLRFLQPITMMQQINKEILQLKTQGKELSIKNEIALLQLLNTPVQEDTIRQFSRDTKYRPCTLTFGIDAINHFLNLRQQELEQILDSSADNFGQHLLESWRIINESEAGLSLTYHKASRHDVRVGDIIGLLSEESIEGKRNGRIAVICWIRSDHNNRIHIGTKFIPGNLLPAMGRLTDGPNINNTFPAIFVSSQPQHDRPATLLTSKKIYQKNRVLEVTIGEQPMRVKAGALQDDSFVFDRFDFTSLHT